MSAVLDREQPTSFACQARNSRTEMRQTGRNEHGEAKVRQTEVGVMQVGADRGGGKAHRCREEKDSARSEHEVRITSSRSEEVPGLQLRPDQVAALHQL